MSDEHEEGWDSIKCYDDLCKQLFRDLDDATIVKAVHKCELLKRKQTRFRFCSLDNPDEEAPVSDSSPLYKSWKTGPMLAMECYNPEGLKCCEYRKRIDKIRADDEKALRKICKDKGIEYFPPEHNDPAAPRRINGSYCTILGRNYPVREFEDRGRNRPMPYIVRYGQELPIICSATVLVQKELMDRQTFLLMQEGKEGSGTKRKDKGKLDTPGGGVENGETFQDCAKREFFEETGVLPEITGLIGLVERINQNNRLVWKAAYAGNLTTIQGGLLKPDTMGFAFFNTHMIQVFATEGGLKSPDITLLVNRAEKNMVMGEEMLGTEESRIRLGWD